MRQVGDRDNNPSLTDIKVRQDGFSLQAYLPGDAKFRLRIHSDLDEADGVRTLVVSDLFCGAQHTQFAGQVLADLMRSFTDVQQVRFLDVYPLWQEDPRFEIELERRITDLRAVLKVALGESSVGLVVARERNKYNVTKRL